MRKTDAVVLRETQIMAIWTAIFSLIMQSVFLIFSIWDYTVLLGNLLSALAVIFNFFLMGRTVQSAVAKEEKDARNAMKLSQSLRMLVLFLVVVLGVVLDCFNTWAVIIPLIFPRIAIAIRPLWDKELKEKKEESDK